VRSRWTLLLAVLVGVGVVVVVRRRRRQDEPSVAPDPFGYAVSAADALAVDGHPVATGG
jgi:hypothetical protein